MNDDVFYEYRDKLASLTRIRKAVFEDGNIEKVIEIEEEMEHILTMMKIAADDRRSMILVDMLIDMFLKDRIVDK